MTTEIGAIIVSPENIDKPPSSTLLAAQPETTEFHIRQGTTTKANSFDTLLSLPPRPINMYSKAQIDTHLLLLNHNLATVAQPIAWDKILLHASQLAFPNIVAWLATLCNDLILGFPLNAKNADNIFMINKNHKVNESEQSAVSRQYFVTALTKDSFGTGGSTTHCRLPNIDLTAKQEMQDMQGCEGWSSYN